MNEDEEIRRIKEKKLQKLIKQRSKETLEKKSKYPTSPINVTDDTLQSIVQKYPVVVVDCWAEWCGPCHMISSVIEQLAAELSGKVIFGKLNVDENQVIPTKFGIMSIPTLLIFKEGKHVDTLIGALNKKTLLSQLKPYIS
jgi:thioredoxin 1